MKLTLINDLNESTQYRSKSFLKQTTAREIVDHAFMDILALWILYNEYGFATNAIDYAKSTIAHNNFHLYKQTNTDLYMALHVITQKRSDLLNSKDEDAALLDRLFIDITLLRRYLKKMGSNSLSVGEARQLLQKIEPNFAIRESSFRSIRRLVQSWDTLDNSKKRLVITRMALFYRRHARRSEMYQLLKQLAAEKKVDLNDKSKMSTTAKIAAAGAAGIAGYHLGRRIAKSLI